MGVSQVKAGERPAEQKPPEFCRGARQRQATDNQNWRGGRSEWAHWLSQKAVWKR